MPEKPLTMTEIAKSLGITRQGLWWRLNKTSKAKGKTFTPVSHWVYGAKSLLHSYKNSAKRRKIPWSLSDAEALGIAIRPCYYCGLQPSRELKSKTRKSAGGGRGFICTGIDRKDSNGAYDLENCVPCCTRCNVAKRAMSDEEFIVWAIRVAVNVTKMLDLQL